MIIAANQVTEEGLRIFSTVHIFTALDIIMEQQENYSGIKNTVFWDAIPYYMVILTNMSDVSAFQDDEGSRMFCELLLNSCQTTQHHIPDDIHGQHFGDL